MQTGPLQETQKTQTTRRQFLARSAAAAAAAGLLPAARALAAPAPASAFGVQLYTVRDQVKTEPERVLAAIRAMGYATVETFSGQYTRPASELRRLIVNAGLTVPSAHFSYDDLGKRFDYAKELGVNDVVCGMAPASIANSRDGFKRAAHQYNVWGEQARSLGLRFGFHNHNSDFQDFDGVTGLDVLLAETDPKLVSWQMDCYWVAEAGLDPLALMRRYRSRLLTLHFKDRKPGVPASTVLDKNAQHFTEIGTGTLDWTAIWSYAYAAGVRYFFVEQDTTEMPPLQSLAISYRNLKRLLV